MNKHNPMYPDFSPIVVDTFKLLEGHVMRDCWFESEEVFVVPPHNETHIVVSHNSNGQYYTSIRDHVQGQGFKHRYGSAESHRSWKAAFERAKAVWEHECKLAASSATKAPRLETKAPSPGLSSEAAQGAPVVSQPQAESACAPAPHHSGAPPQGAVARARSSLVDTLAHILLEESKRSGSLRMADQNMFISALYLEARSRAYEVLAASPLRSEQ